MEEDSFATIYLATEAKILTISFTVGSTIEDLCIRICKLLEIGPVARHLFALRCHSSQLWCPLGKVLDTTEKQKFDFRLRFKPSNVYRLKSIDSKAYDYYFEQARADVMDNKVPDIVYEKHKRELIGLGVSDMYRVMLEKQIPRETVESDYKKYIPKECIRRHAFFIKKPIHQALSRISGPDASYVKEQYLKQFQSIAPSYLCEEYQALIDKGMSNRASKVLLRVNANEIQYCESDSNQWNSLCAIEDLCFISIREDSTVEVSRKNGIPSYLKFGTNTLLMSFVSALDGYYRLAVKWTFNLCRDVITPSLEKLHKLKCHGPVGEEFSLTKLEKKRGNRPGTFIIRQSEKEYNVYYLDACGKDGKVRTHCIQQISIDNFVISHDSVHSYKSIAHLIALHQNPENPLYLVECLPPSEYDESPLLICAMHKVGDEVDINEEVITELLDSGPRCVPLNQLKIHKSPTSTSNYENLNGRKTVAELHRATWHPTKEKKLEVAIKLLKGDESQYTREFLELIGKWGQLRSGALVRMYGLTVAPALGMLLELVQFGPLDAYLRNNSPQTIKTADMVEAGACLANGLWHLEENGIVHGNIRCKNVLVHAHTDNSFIVKLADPGLFNYTDEDIHWLPPEVYVNPKLAKHSSQGDVWALGTTLWEIFSKGITPPTYHDINIVKKFYGSGKRLPIPAECPIEVYKLMTECWGEPNEPRKQPQAIMRDINQILYQVYNSRRTHAYATVFPKLFNKFDRTSKIENEVLDDSSNSESRASCSLYTESTSLPWDDLDDSVKESFSSDTYASSADDLSIYLDWLTEAAGDANINHRLGRSMDFNIGRDENHLKDKNSSNASINDGSNSGSLGQLQSIFELEGDVNVILQGRIGQGFYGEVYRGILEREGSGEDNEPQQVAVKKLKTRALEADLHDFEREISIMKTLKHPNIVEILGVISEPEVCLIMEYVKHGSLQSYLAIHKQTLTHQKLLLFALNIATGMEYLGIKNIVHRDLAARNILVADENHVKISDFGLAQVIGKNDYYILQTNRNLPIKWYAPESLRDGKFSPRSDVWSFGVTMYETFSLGEDPQLPELGLNRRDDTNDISIGVEEGSTELLSALERGVRLPCPPMCPQIVYVKLIHPCWYLRSHDRPDFTTLCSVIKELMTQC